MSTARLPLTRAQGFVGQLLRFAWIELQCCAFAIAVFVGLAGAALIWSRWDPPLARYDALLLYVIAVQALFVATKRESWRELGVVCAFHLAGFALEVFKVAVGSWAYPDAALTKIAGVPLYAGFMYAAVGSYVCQAFRRFDLTVSRYRTGAVLVLALAAYANFFTHHYLPDLRVVIALGFLVVTARSRVWFTVGAALLDAAAAVVRADRILPLGRREPGDLPRRVALPGPGRRVADGARGEVRIVGAAGESELRAGIAARPPRGRGDDGPGGRGGGASSAVTGLCQLALKPTERLSAVPTST
ncbi:hypothetical protein TSHO111613_01230 [Tsukamurella hominis]